MQGEENIRNAIEPEGLTLCNERKKQHTPDAVMLKRKVVSISVASFLSEPAWP